MGLLTTLLTLPVSGPVLGAKWVLERIVEAAEHELYDEATIRRQLAELGMLADLGEIDERQHAEAEEVLLQRLRTARARSAGGPLS